MLLEDDDLVVVDTSPGECGIKEVVERFGGTWHHRPDLLLDLGRKVAEWLPEHAESVEDYPQIADGVLRSFAEARNIASDLAEYDLQFWIDADDVLVEDVPGELRETLEREWEQKQLIQVFLDYEYASDEDGNPTALLKRERIYDRRAWRWKGACHEVLIPKEGVKDKNIGYFRDVRSRIVHKKDHKATAVPTDIRNYLILRANVEREEEEGGFADTRYYYYLANAARGLGKWEEAVGFYKLTLARSGSVDDCFLSASNCAAIHMTEGNMFPAVAYSWAFETIKINPNDPRGYFQAQHAAFLLEKWAESLWWFSVGRQKPAPRNSMHLYEPYDVEIRPMMLAALAAKETGDEQAAKAFLSQLAEAKTTRPDLVTVIDEVSNWLAGRAIARSVQVMALNSGASSNEQLARATRKALEGLKAVPFEIEETGVGRVEVLDPDDRPGSDLVFFCGKAWEPWGPKSAVRGLGGSERAVWEVSRRMARRGFRVSVYASVPAGERGVDPSGVLWRHWAELDEKAPRGTVVYWRSPESLEMPIPAMKRILWSHDVQSPNAWTPARVALCDHLFVLSEFHKGTLKGAVPDSKVVVTRNGIDPDLIRSALQSETKNPKRIIFTSSPDRGALSAIRAFQIARASDPELELHIFYGFSRVYSARANSNWAFHIPDIGHDQSALRYRERVESAAVGTPGVHFHGRLSWPKMAAEFARAGIWLYPTRFWEISCISAMEAQAAGCVCLASYEAALKETIDWEGGLASVADPSDLKSVAEAILSASKIPGDDAQRSLVSEKALERFDWDGVCDEWESYFRVESHEPVHAGT